MGRARRQHSMPFGAALLNDGGVCFQLWAPAARQVELCLEGLSEEDGAILSMTAEPQGWFRCTTPLAHAGTRYRFRIDGEARVPDPASRFQPDDVHGPSEVIDPTAWNWGDTYWQGRPWEEVVLYELHLGTFTPAGNFAGLYDRLDHLAGLGVTAIELMPVADFPGERNWGYDGVYSFAPDHRYGRPEDLKALVDAAHARGLMVFLDVVYNHFGPEGNYLHLYAPRFFTDRHHTPWGAAINYDGADSDWVRQFFIHNALYWLEEYHFDGLRLDAVHAIVDDSQPDILSELAERVRQHFAGRRHVHLVLENDHNAAHYLIRDTTARPQEYVAQWNDDIHHALHVLLTGESHGYYMDYADDPLRHLGRCLSEGFAYQGECSAYRDGAARGEPSAHLPATAFVSFLQNHDQIGNRALGERIELLVDPQPLRAAMAMLLLAPSPPLLFMGQEWGCRQPFLFFCDFGPDLAEKVSAGRRAEFARFPGFREPAARARIPDPMDRQSFTASALDWTVLDQPEHRHWLELHRELLSLRHRQIIPRLQGPRLKSLGWKPLTARALSARWMLGDGSELVVVANLGDETLDEVDLPRWPLLYATPTTDAPPSSDRELPPWSVFWYLGRSGAAS